MIAMSLAEYKRKRNFGRTPEPAANSKRVKGHCFVIQKHAASRLHYDFRLELDGTLKSWAVPKGPSLNPSVKSLAVQVEDHPLDYANFEGVIPPGQYGGGTVMVWDRGTWDPEGDASKDFKRGKLSFELHGEKLLGRWSLVRMSGRAGDDGKNWLLIKSDDKAANKRKNILTSEPNSVLSGREMQEIASAKDKTWQSKSNSRSKTKSNAARISIKSKRESRQQISSTSVSQLTGAVKKALPKEFKPQLATLGTSVPQGDSWLHEMKFDGYRLFAYFNKGKIRLVTRNGNDWTRKFPTVAKELSKLNLESAILDGEVVLLDEHGLPNFQLLQNLLKQGDDNDIVFYLFDVPYCSGYSLTKTPLIERKSLLEKILGDFLKNNDVIRYSEHIEGQGVDVLANACKLKMEGVVSKQRDSGYLQARSPAWIKAKCTRRQEFVIGGFTKPTGSRIGFGALLLGYYEGEKFTYAGRVGTGFNNASLRQLHTSLKKIKRETFPFSKGLSRTESRGVTWVTPELVAEVEFTEWTSEGLLRHPSFQGLREDKPAKQITREVPKPTKQLQTKTNKNRTSKRIESNTDEADSVVAGVEITHPDRVLYPEQGLTKHDLAKYYESVADWILPYVVGRPLTMVRCPQGRKGKCFFQKHLTDSLPDTLEGVVVNKDEGKYVVLNDLSGLVSLVQMGVLEIHPWGSRADSLEKPDQVVFDLDPGPDVAWSEVINAARHLRKLLIKHKLKSFVRTSGGKGLHVVIPIKPDSSWEVIKEFSRSIAFDLQHTEPDRFVAVASKAKRTDRIFVDYLRNSRGATSVASYSTRAREGAPVAMPLRWEELGKVKSADQYTVRNALRRLGSLRKDPWDGFFKVRQTL
jgi:bifunctional non-homologous end joining protein LigD